MRRVPRLHGALGVGGEPPMIPRYPPAPPGVSRLSCSDLELFLRCPHLYQRRGELERRTTVPIAVGSAVAAAARLDNVGKQRGRQPPLADLRDAAVSAYDLEVTEREVAASRLEVAVGRDDTASATLAYGSHVSPRIELPLVVEEPIIAELEPGLQLAGTPDCITDGIVRDTKTGRRAWDQTRVDRSVQLTGYALLYEARFGALPARVAIDAVTLHESRHRRAWVAEDPIYSARNESDIERFIARARSASLDIGRGVDHPCAEISWWCSQDYCPLWAACSVRPGR